MNEWKEPKKQIKNIASEEVKEEIEEEKEPITTHQAEVVLEEDKDSGIVWGSQQTGGNFVQTYLNRFKEKEEKEIQKLFKWWGFRPRRRYPLLIFWIYSFYCTLFINEGLFLFSSHFSPFSTIDFSNHAPFWVIFIWLSNFMHSYLAEIHIWKHCFLYSFRYLNFRFPTHFPFSLFWFILMQLRRRWIRLHLWHHIIDLSQLLVIRSFAVRFLKNYQT